MAPASGLEAVPGGPVVLDGNDPDDHYPSISTYMQDVYTNLDSNLAPGYVHNDEVAVVGTCAASMESRTTIAETFVTFDDAAEVESLFLNIGSNNYKILHICSDDDGTLSSGVENELDKWGSAIAAHVNRGGGLFSTGHSYNWLGDLFPSLTVSYGGTSSSYVTADGATFFATLTENTQVNAINHYTFSDVDTTTLLPLLSESTGGAGRLVAIGGTTVRFPQISFTGPSTGEVGSNESFTLVAADADGTPLSNNSFDYTISGVTDDVASGSAVTDASGEYTFDLTGNAKGTTTITVQMTLGTGESAGSAITTTWATLPSAPTITSAVDVGGGERQRARLVERRRRWGQGPHRLCDRVPDRRRLVDVVR